MRKGTYISLMTLLLMALAGAIRSQAQVAPVAVIAHPSVPHERLDDRALLDLYSLEDTRWSDGARVVLFDYKGKSEMKDRFYRFLGRRSSDMKRVWLRVILSGEGRSPTLLRTGEEVLEQVRLTPGSVGYVPASLVTDEVKVVALIE